MIGLVVLLAVIGSMYKPAPYQPTASEANLMLRYDDEGTWVGLTKVRLTVTLDEAMDAFTGAGIAEDIDLDGNVVATRRPSATYHRMRVEPPA